MPFLSSEITQNLYISCNVNKGFYKLLDKKVDNNSFLECYNNTPYGYHLNNDSYNLAKRCDKFEEFNFNNNKKCSSNYSTLLYFSCSKYYYCDSSNYYFCIEKEKCRVNYQKLILNKQNCIDIC